MGKQVFSWVKGSGGEKVESVICEGKVSVESVRRMEKVGESARRESVKCSKLHHKMKNLHFSYLHFSFSIISLWELELKAYGTHFMSFYVIPILLYYCVVASNYFLFFFILFYSSISCLTIFPSLTKIGKKKRLKSDGKFFFCVCYFQVFVFWPRDTQPDIFSFRFPPTFLFYFITCSRGKEKNYFRTI